jgi:hypothetical protein
MDSVDRMVDFSGTRRGAYPGRATAARACAGADAATAKDMSIGSGRAPTGARDEWRESRPNPVCDVACTDGKSRRGRRVVSDDDSRREVIQTFFGGVFFGDKISCGISFTDHLKVGIVDACTARVVARASRASLCVPRPRSEIREKRVVVRFRRSHISRDFLQLGRVVGG